MTTEEAWKQLNKRGIYTKKQLKGYLDKYPINIGMFTK